MTSDKTRLVFCLDCGECLGEHTVNCAKEHLIKYPLHDNFLVKTILDPLLLNDPDLWFRHFEACQPKGNRHKFSTDKEPEPETTNIKYLGTLIYRKSR